MAKIRNKMKDLTTVQGRNAEVKKIEDSFLWNLRNYDFIIAGNAVCVIDRHKIELGIKSTRESFILETQSIVDLYAERKNAAFSDRKNEINFGASGNFTPNDTSCYWRTIHAAEILKQWDLACKLINQHCKAYAELERELLDIITKRIK
ncbi:MAG TPA: hypothetical protein PLN38_08220 [Chitinophagales bacterium]|nr:hypothetical protein [Chitinophagales bacterium]